MKNIRIDADRLWQSLMEMAQIGATEKGGCCRLALSELDRVGRDLFVRWCREAGCAVSVDAVGNVFARRGGRNDELAPIMMGSHLDTQPTGGKFDGVLGVLAGLEVIRTLNDHDIETETPVEVCMWTNEEGSRFAPAMMGSGVFAGVFDLDEVRATQDRDGKCVGDELARIGYAGETPVGGRPVGAYFELHIEQGPILEAAEKTIGVVTGGQGIRWFDVTLTGQEAHAGPTPMPRRRDALVAAAGIVQEVNRIGREHPPHACATVGTAQVHPNSRNVIPGRVDLTVDLRHPQADTLDVMEGELRRYCERLIRDMNVEVALKRIWYSPPTPFDPACVEAVREGAQAGAYPHREIVSGAGHDAIYLSRVAPTGMIFIPCEDGISHNEIENATREDCAAGCDVLLHAVLNRAEATASG